MANGNGNSRAHKEIFGIVRREGQEKAHWARIGTAFENRDESWTLKFDFIPTDPETGIQLRDPKPREEEDRGNSRRDSNRSRRG